MTKSNGTLEALLSSDDIRSIALMVGACALGFTLAWPSPPVVRVAFVAAATYGVSMWILAGHNSMEDIRRLDNTQATSLYSTQPREGEGDAISERSKEEPFATMVHPEAASAIASLAALSMPGRRTAVRSVALATEEVVRAYHAMLDSKVTLPSCHASPFMDHLRDRTIFALEALQGLRMETGSRGRAAKIAATAEHRLRRLFVRFRQIASNRMRAPGLYGAPYAFDPRDDLHFLR